MSLGATITEACRIYRDMRAQGQTKAEAVAYLEGVLRQTWPRKRGEPWRYLCNECDDTGLRVGECSGDATCGRGKAHGPHSFGAPCWCSLGARFKAKPKTAEDYESAAGKTARRGFSRMGR